MSNILTLNELRNRLDQTKKDCINVVWDYYRDKGEGIKCRVLHQRVGKERALNALKELGGTIIYETQDRYNLTFLGILLTDEFNGKEDLLVKYFEYVKDRFIENPEIETINSADVMNDLSMSVEESCHLGELLFKGSLFSGSASRRKETWSMGLPHDIDDISEIEDIRYYVIDNITKHYNPELPVLENDRRNFFYHGKKENSEEIFWFVDNEELRVHLSSDLSEVQKVYNCGAWKSCVVLCGGIIEGLLLNLILRDKEIAEDAYFRVRKRKFSQGNNQWNLANLVEVSKELGIIGKTTFHLSHAIREYRNLIHPERQMREDLIVSEDEANIAYNALKVCIKELSNYCSNK